MPEGHTIHREARLQSQAFGGESLRVWSPQGRFSAGAEVLDGQRLVAVGAWGKHLFYEWGNDQWLHVHLGLFGRFRRFGFDAPGATEGTRLAVSGSSSTQYLSGPTICELIDPERRETIISDLGPDPLRPETHAGAVDHMMERLGRRTVPISAALLDQSVVAGLGNVFRSELLFLTGLNPLIESRHVPRARVEGIWSEAIRQLKRGERSGTIVTTDPEDVARETRSDISIEERTYVYKRRAEPCRRCATPIERSDVSSRRVWWCPTCQPPSSHHAVSRSQS